MNQQFLDVPSWLTNSHSCLEKYAPQINAINVFPVADADTGTNMVATLSHALVAGSAEQRVQACLRDAHGNSGTILAAWLAGFLADFQEETQSLNLASALVSGAQRARAVLLEPVEGTMLTVMDSLSAENLVLDAYEATIATALVERAQNRVDAGAVGFLCVISELARALNMALISETRISGLLPRASAQPTGEPLADGEIEVMFNLLLPSDKLATLRDVLPELGNSVSVSELASSQGEAQVAVHIHTQFEKKVLRFAQRLGTLENVRTSSLHG